MNNWLDKFDEEGKSSNKKSRKVKTSNPSYNLLDDPRNQPTVYPSTERSYYDPLSNNIYFNPNNNPEDPASILKHEGWHWAQNMYGDFQNPDLYQGPLQRPQTPINPNNPLIVDYYNRPVLESIASLNNTIQRNPNLREDIISYASPSMQFVPRDILWNGIVTTRDGQKVHIPGADDYRYNVPGSIEGNAQSYQDWAPDTLNPIMGRYDFDNGSYNPYMHKHGGMIKRADGSYSRRGLWDNIRANRGSGRKPTAEMLRQERKINKYADGGPTAPAQQKKYWTEKDVYPEYWAEFKKKYPYAIGIDPNHVGEDDMHLPIFDMPKVQPKTPLLINDDSSSFDEKLKPQTAIPVTTNPVRKILNPDFQESDYTDKHNSIVDPLGNPKYKYYNQDKVIGEHEYNTIQGYGGGGGVYPPPTAADSLAVYNNAVALKNFYDNEVTKGRIAKAYETRISGMYTNSKELEHGLGNLKKENEDYYNKQINFRNSRGYGVYDTDYAKYYGYTPAQIAQREKNGLALSRNKEPYKFYYRDIITPAQNLGAPYGIIDTRIMPQMEVDYYPTIGNYPGEHVNMITYDPLAVKPRYMRSDAEQKEWEKKYGNPWANTNNPQPPNPNPKPPIPPQHPKEYIEPIKPRTLKDIQQKFLNSTDNFTEELKPISKVDIPVEPIRKVMNPDFDWTVDTLPNRTKDAVVDALGHPRYKYYNNDKVISEQDYNQLKGYKEGSWVTDSSIPVPTSPSYYPAGGDRTLTNYQMDTPKAPMYGGGGGVAPFITSNPDEYNYRKQAYADSVDAYNYGQQNLKNAQAKLQKNINNYNAQLPLYVSNIKLGQPEVFNYPNYSSNVIRGVIKGVAPTNNIYQSISSLSPDQVFYIGTLGNPIWTKVNLAKQSYNIKPEYEYSVDLYDAPKQKVIFDKNAPKPPKPQPPKLHDKEYIEPIKRKSFDDIKQDLILPTEDYDMQPIRDEAPKGFTQQPTLRMVPNPKFNPGPGRRTKEAVVDQSGNPKYVYYNGDDVITKHEYSKLWDKQNNAYAQGGLVMYNAGSTVWTNQDTPLWAAGTPTPTSTQHFKNDRSINTDRYRIGDVIPTGMDYKTPAAGTHDYNQDVQPYPTTRLHAPDTTMMGDGSYVNRFNTKLKGKELEGFNYHSKLFGSLLNDTGDYDIKGFYQEVYNKYNGDLDAITQALTPGSPTQHIGTDRFKKPNHPTFSNESKYSIPLIRPGGKWGHNEEDNSDYFVAKNRNIKNMNASDGSPLNYFKRAEDYNQDGTPDVHMIYKGNMMFKHGGHIKKHINSPRVYGNPVNPSSMTEGPSMQRGVMFADGGIINKYEDAGFVADCPNGYVKSPTGDCIPVSGMGLTTSNLRQSFLNSQQQAANAQAQTQNDLQSAMRGITTQPASTTYAAPKNLTAKKFSQDLAAANGNIDRMNLMNGLKEAKRQEQPDTIKAISDNPNEDPFVLAQDREDFKEAVKTGLKAIPAIYGLEAAYAVPYLAPLLDAGFIGHGLYQAPKTVEAWKNPNVSGWDATKQTATNALDFLPLLTIGGHTIDALRDIKYNDTNIFDYVGKNMWERHKNIKNPITKEHVIGLAHGLKDISNGRPFFETFPITPGQVNKMKMQQDVAAARATDWLKDWYYPNRVKAEGEGFKMLNSTPDLDKTAYDISQNNLSTAQTWQTPLWNSDAILNARPLLTSTRRGAVKQDIAKVLNLDVNSKEVATIVDKINGLRGKAEGVMLHDIPDNPITFRNFGFYYQRPQSIFNTAGHEFTHTVDKYNNGFHPFISNGSHFYQYYVPSSNPLGMEFKAAMPEANNEYELLRKDLANQGIFPLYEKDFSKAPSHLQQQLKNLYDKSYLWEGYPGELHAELNPARMNTYYQYLNEGKSHQDIIDALKNPSDDMLEHLITRGNLNKFFKPTTTPQAKYSILKRLYAEGGVVNKYADGDVIGNDPINGGYPLLQNAINSQMDWAPQSADLPIDPYTGAPIKNLKEVTIAASPTTHEQWGYLEGDYQKRAKELKENPSKWNINDWTTYGIKEPDTTAEGIYDPLNLPALIATGGLAAEGLTAAGTAALPYTTAALGTLSAPAVIGGNTIPWLTADNLMSAYFGSQVPQNIQEGNYVEAGLNSMPFWLPKAITGVSKIKEGTQNLINQWNELGNINVPYVGESPIATEGVNNYNKLNIKSLFEGSDLEKQVSKTGDIHINNLNAYINKAGVSKADKFMMEQVLQDKFPNQTNINYNQFKNEVSQKLVELEREVIPNYQHTRYGHERLGYSSVSEENVNKSIGYINEEIEKQKSSIADWEKYIENIKNTTYLDDAEKANQIKNATDFIEDAKRNIEYNKEKIRVNLDILKNTPKSETVTYSNAKQFGMGNKDHFNSMYVKQNYLDSGDGLDMTETLGHARSFVNSEEPTIKHIIEAQSDFSQKKYSRMSKDKADLEQAAQFAENDLDSTNRHLKDAKDELNLFTSHDDSFFSMTKEEYNNRVKNLQDNVTFITKMQAENYKKAELAKNSLKNFEQKYAYQEFSQERLLQEEVSQAAREGMSTVRYPTRETAIKVQGYQQSSRQNKIDYLQEQLDILTNPEAYKAKNGQTWAYDNTLNNVKYKWGNNTQQYMDDLTKQITEQTNLLATQGDLYYLPEHETILKKYENYDKTLKKLFGTDVKIVTDSKGNTWYQFDIPEKWKQGKGEIKAFARGGLVTKNNNSNAWLDQYN